MGFFEGLKTLPRLRSHDAAPLIRHKKCSQLVQGVLQVGPVHADASAGRSTNTKLALHIYYGAPRGLGSGTPPSLQQEAVVCVATQVIVVLTQKRLRCIHTLSPLGECSHAASYAPLAVLNYCSGTVVRGDYGKRSTTVVSSW